MAIIEAGESERRLSFSNLLYFKFALTTCGGGETFTERSGLRFIICFRVLFFIIFRILEFTDTPSYSPKQLGNFAAAKQKQHNGQNK
jgi:hypothetical protein